ncbi:hypothetical protein [uncultured Bartonella sp.]|uniref:hypothetical protein n=1 Tax=uncultured Bartonella sp. TaxID=104108 RepID=UPI0025ED671F|nr:hypothetical protein [uncultured Bartonella sp.]
MNNMLAVKSFRHQSCVRNFCCCCFAQYDVLIVSKNAGVDMLLTWQSYNKFLDNRAGSCSVSDTDCPDSKISFYSEKPLLSFNKHTSETAKQGIFILLELMSHLFFNQLKNDAGFFVREKLTLKEKLQKICLNRQSLIRRRDTFPISSPVRCRSDADPLRAAGSTKLTPLVEPPLKSVAGLKAANRCGGNMFFYCWYVVGSFALSIQNLPRAGRAKSVLY